VQRSSTENDRGFESKPGRGLKEGIGFVPIEDEEEEDQHGSNECWNKTDGWNVSIGSIRRYEEEDRYDWNECRLTNKKNARIRESAPDRQRE